jgi:hypothetical protein
MNGEPERSTEAKPASTDSRRDAKQNGEPQDRPGSAAAPQNADLAKTSEAQSHSEQNANSREQFDNGPQGSSGLLDKMKDALSGLMTKMRPNQNSAASPQDQKQAPDTEARGNQNATGKNQQAKQEQGSRQAGQDQSSEAQAQGLTTEKAEAGQGRNSGESPHNGSESNSGIGRQDGDKRLKEAEQLRAMGKLAEIIGKRSASLTGDMVVETSSSKQQLKTAYSQRIGRHADLGGEIDRDEIPIADQQYIREYMELVRKTSKNPD